MIRNKWLITEEYKAAGIEILQSNLAPLRAKIGISQEELSNIIGLSRQSYCAIEAGKREMMWSTYLSLVFFFDSIQTTSEMMEELRIYPIDLVMRFNDRIDPSIVVID